MKADVDHIPVKAFIGTYDVDTIRLSFIVKAAFVTRKLAVTQGYDDLGFSQKQM